jgi:hypothetical protein
MHLELPLEQLVRGRGQSAQLAFATEAMARLPRRKDVVAAPSALGLHLLARDEEALEGPAQVLSEAYGKALDILPPKVRVIHGVRPEEPIMHVEISVDRRYARKVRRTMSRRNARRAAEFERLFSIMRYEAPLADLLGLAPELDRLTKGTAIHWMALSHYAHVDLLSAAEKNHHEAA